jgi:hypothetical protein
MLPHNFAHVHCVVAETAAIDYDNYSCDYYFDIKKNVVE